MALAPGDWTAHVDERVPGRRLRALQAAYIFLTRVFILRHLGHAKMAVSNRCARRAATCAICSKTMCSIRTAASCVAGPAWFPLRPKCFDILAYVIRNRELVVSKDDLIAAVWGGRIVSESALTTRINAARSAIGDSGEQQRLIKTLASQGHPLCRRRA